MAGEEAFFFEHRGARLFGVAHTPRSAGGRPAGGNLGCVLCHPYAEEKQFSHRIAVRFARDLCREGIPALRFDCLGYGDSEGELHDGTLEDQVQATLSAAQLARERLGVERVALLGLRLGATVAAIAAERDPRLAGLVLWSPIPVGAAYLDELIRKRLLAQILSRAPRKTAEEVRELLASEGHIEIEGNRLTRGVADELVAIDLPAQVGSFRGPVLITAVADRRGSQAASEALAAAYVAKGADSEVQVVGSRPYWDDRCLNEWYLPEPLFDHTSKWMRRACLER